MPMTRWFLLLGAALGAAPAFADNAAMLRCRTIAEGPARLACYDAIALPGIGSRAGWGAPVPGAAPAAPGQATAANAPVAPADAFGLEGRAFAAGGPLDRLETRIVGRFEGWTPKSQFRMANGQVWAIAENSETFYNLVEPKVTLRKGLFDAIYMDVEGVAQSPRVKRVR